MANIFKQNKDVNNKVKRNNFDLSFQNHLTMKFGTLYPVFCKEVVPGDSFRIDSAFGLKFMPLVFPVQSGMRATMHFFYCRNKNLWKNWENWVSNLEEHTHPYIAQDAPFFKTGSLADYLDIPTTLISTSAQRLPMHGRGSSLVNWNEANTYLNANFEVTEPFYIGASNPFVYGTPFSIFAHHTSGNLTSTPAKALFFTSPLASPLSDGRIYCQINNPPSDLSDLPFNIIVFESDDDNIENSHIITGDEQHFSTDSEGAYVNLDSDVLSTINERIGIGKKIFLVFVLPYAAAYSTSFNLLLSTESQTFDSKNGWYFYSFYYNADVTLPVDTSQVSSVPYGSGSGQIHLNALSFRAYQSCYNAYYRNWQNQPYLVNGSPVFNQYIDNNDDGADTTDYHLYQRNYELDFLTSGLPSPQQGNAPLVGMSALGTITIEDEDGITTAQAQLADDNQTIVGVNVTSPIAGRAHALTLAEIASAGMSINDFRNTNALQRWLEVNMRKGYRYLDFIAGHHDVTPKYKELDMPEFIGGYSRDVQVNSILNQTASPDSDPLGSFAGVANCFGGSNHSITHYCDDYGWIIGILCVVPQPAYSQLLPKHYLKYSPLDYYFPEFAQLGMQPVTYEEVCPVQSWFECLADQTKSMQDTFCYQRPNYDMVSYTDQVHGNFRTDLRNFLINRIFANRPQLGDEFLQINPEEVNDIFQVTTPDNDVIAGQIVFRVHAKRPIPRIHMPSLGR